MSGYIWLFLQSLTASRDDAHHVERYIAEAETRVFYTYIMASGPYGTLYVGSTDNLRRRAWQHRTHDIPGFTATYGVDKLVWFEMFELRENAFRRERRIKEWKRDWKIRLIEEKNPAWRDLYEDLNDLLPL